MFSLLYSKNANKTRTSPVHFTAHKPLKKLKKPFSQFACSWFNLFRWMSFIYMITRKHFFTKVYHCCENFFLTAMLLRSLKNVFKRSLYSISYFPSNSTTLTPKFHKKGVTYYISQIFVTNFASVTVLHFP